MKKKKSTEPEQVNLTEDQIKDLQAKIKLNKLSIEEQDLLIKSLQGIVWLNKMLQAKKMSMRRLMRLFGFKSEKQPKPKDDKDDKDDDDSEGPGAGNSDPERKIKGHGKNGADKYSGAKCELHEHDELEAGDRCPDCDRGNLYEVKSGVFVKVEGTPPMQATVHKTQKFRCGTCGKIFEAKLPENIGTEKYAPSADITIALLKYAMGLPFFRLGKWQKMIGVPLAPSTAWERVENLASSIYPVYEALIKYASKLKKVHIDDTTAKILDFKKELQDSGLKRSGIYTTGFIGLGENRVNLFFTGNKHAGENLGRVLDHRDKQLGPVIQMSDALASNFAHPHDTLACLCLSHGRRNFYDFLPEREKECHYILHLFGKIYFHDKIAKERGFTDEERLHFHQKKSLKIVKKLRRWCLKMFYLKKIEPNEGVGEAIQYLLNNWKGLTQFLRVAGAELDNNIAERLLKRAILHRKNSLFFKTRIGAYVGDIVMSLVETCNSAGVNPFKYLLALHQNKKLIHRSPESYFPWNYQETLLHPNPV